MKLIRKICTKPCIYIIDNFLSANECSSLIRMAKRKGLSQAQIGKKNNIKALKHYRKSSTVFFGIKENRLVTNIENRIVKLTKIPLNHGEKFQIAHYEAGGYYNEHYDFSHDPKDIAYDRLVTLLIYLNDAMEGGETYFPELGFRVVPKKGRALLCYNCNNMQLPLKKALTANFPRKLGFASETLHAGMPVRQGKKWIMTKWLHKKALVRQFNRPNTLK